MSVAESVWRRTALPLDSTIKQAVSSLNETGLQIVLILDDNDILLGTVTDGDIRRGLLNDLTLDSPVSSVMQSNSFVVPPDMGNELVIQLMRTNRFRQLPVVDAGRHVVGLHLWEEVAAKASRPNIMIIMAGGLGRRLRPHTESCPKPMLKVAGKPMMEHIVERAKSEGFNHFVFAVQYLGHMVEDYFGSGERHNIRIDYLRETTPLGTAGALSLLNPRPTTPFVVTNGDVLSDIRYGDLLEFHSRHAATATMAVRLHEWQHPYGVVQTEGVDIIGFEEKPIARTHINAGIYALTPAVLDAMALNAHCDMPALFEQLQGMGLRTVAYPMHEPWLDVGRPEDLNLVNQNT
jgi:dTDP-glucose pyrophosphorylase